MNVVVLSPVLCNSFTSSWSCSVHLLLGRPISLFTVMLLLVSGCFLFTCWSCFYWQLLIWHAAFSWFSLLLMTTFMFVPCCEARESLRKRICAATSCFCPVNSPEPASVTSVAFEMVLWNFSFVSVDSRLSRCHFMINHNFDAYFSDHLLVSQYKCRHLARTVRVTEVFASNSFSLPHQRPFR